MFKVEVIGNIGADAKIVNENGNEFVSFSIAHSEKRNEKEITLWVSVTSSNKKIAKYLTKGVKVFVRGNSSINIYKDKNGVSNVGLKLYASEIELCGNGIKESVKDNNYVPNPSAPNEGEKKDGENEDMPF